ncbi:hypothetical protein BGZ60DRAFT_401174, partial [Tricladium varicosporioides]
MYSRNGSWQGHRYLMAALNFALLARGWLSIIDKCVPQELQTTINSMFRYYQRANNYYLYLSNVQVPDEVTVTQAFQI